MNATTHGDANGLQVPAPVGPGLGLLLQAYEYADQVSRDAWDFAVEISALRAAGLNENDLRYLVCKEFVRHAAEIAPASKGGRRFRQESPLTFGDRSCFVLTDEGAAVARRVTPCHRASNGQASHAAAGLSSSSGTNGSQPAMAADATPRWDPHRRELRVGGVLVKQFKLPSPNQEMILVVFEEERWAPRIDDPLPPHPELDPKRRLHDTIKSLNRNQKNRVIRFMGDGSGQGIRWELIVPAPPDGRNGNGQKTASTANGSDGNGHSPAKKRRRKRVVVGA